MDGVMTEPTTVPSIVHLLSDVMQEVRKVGKRDRNQTQNYNFRGVDAVINAVGPVLRKLGVIVTPNVQGIHFDSYETNKGSKMLRVVVTVTYTFTGPGGD